MRSQPRWSADSQHTTDRRLRSRTHAGGQPLRRRVTAPDADDALAERRVRGPPRAVHPGREGGWAASGAGGVVRVQRDPPLGYTVVSRAPDDRAAAPARETRYRGPGGPPPEKAPAATLEPAAAEAWPYTPPPVRPDPALAVESGVS